MDNIDIAFWWAACSLPLLAILLRYLFRTRYNELIALHLAMFWAQYFPYGAVWSFKQSFFLFPAWIMVLLAFELTVYCVVFLLLAVPFREYVRAVSDAALEIRPRVLFFWLALSGGLMAYTFAAYGAVALITYADVANAAGLPIWLTYLSGLFTIPAWGAVFCCSVRVAYRRFHPVQILGVLYLLMHLLTEGAQGKRQMLIVCAVAVLFGPRRPIRITWRGVVGGMAAAVVMFAVWGWYEGVRNNLKSSLMEGRAYDSSVDMAADLLTPSAQQSATDLVMERELGTRQPPIWLLIEIIELPRLAGGAFFAQDIENALPSALTNKTFHHVNDIFAAEFGFPWDDYPWTLLTQSTAEISFLAVILVPLFYMGEFWLLWYVIGHWRGRSNMVVLAAIYTAIYAGGEVQTVLFILLSHLRELALFLVVALVWEQIAAVARIVKSRFDHRMGFTYIQSDNPQYPMRSQRR